MIFARVQNSEVFRDAPEVAMDVHLAIDMDTAYLVVGQRVAIPLEPEAMSELDASYLDMPWVRSNLPLADREAASGSWINELHRNVRLVPVTRENYADVEGLVREGFAAMAVSPLGPLLPPPRRPSSI